MNSNNIGIKKVDISNEFLTGTIFNMAIDTIDTNLKQSKENSDNALQTVNSLEEDFTSLQNTMNDINDSVTELRKGLGVNCYVKTKPVKGNIFVITLPKKTIKDLITVSKGQTYKNGEMVDIFYLTLKLDLNNYFDITSETDKFDTVISVQRTLTSNNGPLYAVSNILQNPYLEYRDGRQILAFATIVSSENDKDCYDILVDYDLTITLAKFN